MVAGPVADLVAWKEPPVWFGESAEVTGQERGKEAKYRAKQWQDFAVSRRSPRARSSPLFAAPRPGSMETAESAVPIGPGPGVL